MNTNKIDYLAIFQRESLTLLEPLLIFLGILLIGLMFELWLYRIILRKLRKSRIRWLTFMFQSQRGLFFLGFFILSGTLTLPLLPLKEASLAPLRRFFTAVLILLITIMLSRLVVGLARIYNQRMQNRLLNTSIISNILRVLFILIGSMVILQTLGISITPILTALGVGGLAVALALQETLGNLFAGLQIIVTRQLNPGEYIGLDDGQEGYIKDINWRSTSIQTIYDNLVIIPNSQLSSKVIKNYHRPKREMTLRIPIGVSYDSDLEHVERVTIEEAEEVIKRMGKLDMGNISQPYIRYNTFNDFSIDFFIVIKIDEFFEQYRLQHELIKSIHQRYKREDIVIPFPIRTLEWKEAGNNE